MVKICDNRKYKTCLIKEIPDGGYLISHGKLFMKYDIETENRIRAIRMEDGTKTFFEYDTLVIPVEIEINIVE